MSAATDTDAPIVGSKGNMGGTLIDVQDLVMHFPVTEGILIPKVVARVKAVDGISFSIRKGETLGLVGNQVAVKRRRVVAFCAWKIRHLGRSITKASISRK